MIVIVEGFPEADPDVEQTQAATQAAKKTGRDQSAKPGISEQKIVVGPLGRPGQNQEQHAGNGANEDKKKDGSAMQPELQPGVGLSRRSRRG